MRVITVRRIVINVSFIFTFFVSTLLPFNAPFWLRSPIFIFGVFLLGISLIRAYKIHRGFPKRHESPKDFPKLMKEGPYSKCRHPFYFYLILVELSIPLVFFSLYGLLAFLLTIPLWHFLIKAEEKELIEYWGEEYLEYMKKVPVIPCLRKFKGR